MHFSRRLFLRLAAGAAALSASSRITRAQAYPSRPVRLIVGLAAGGGQDIVARLMGQWLSDRLGRQFITENRPGASGNLALEAVANAPPDGYTLALLGVNNAINASLYSKPGFEFLRDIVPVAGIMRVPLVMVVHPSFPADGVTEIPAELDRRAGPSGSSAARFMSTPMRRNRSGCCARAASGHPAAALPSPTMNFRRFTRSPRRRVPAAQSEIRSRAPWRRRW
jgi:tripartite-type tricarboxylate transporter receptor subunit TctC